MPKVEIERDDLVRMSRWKCEHPAKQGPCTPDAVSAGDCCCACKGRAFAERMLLEADRPPHVLVLRRHAVFELVANSLEFKGVHSTRTQAEDDAVEKAGIGAMRRYVVMPIGLVYEERTKEPT